MASSNRLLHPPSAQVCTSHVDRCECYRFVWVKARRPLPVGLRLPQKAFIHTFLLAACNPSTNVPFASSQSSRQYGSASIHKQHETACFSTFSFSSITDLEAATPTILQLTMCAMCIVIFCFLND